MKLLRFLVVPWFLWSMVYPPGGSYRMEDIHATAVHEYVSQTECEEGLKEYRIEVDKAFPQPKHEGLVWVTWTTVELKCSPVNPQP